jgi:hypothetical protein
MGSGTVQVPTRGKGSFPASDRYCSDEVHLFCSLSSPFFVWLPAYRYKLLVVMIVLHLYVSVTQ